MFFYLLLFLKKYTSNDEIVFNTVKVLRTLIIKSNWINLEKGYDEFLKKLNEFFCLVLEDDNADYVRNFVNDLISLLDAKYEAINISIEIFLFLSFLCNQENENFKKQLQKSDKFGKILQKIISYHSYDENLSKLISQCIAQLPIEDFDHD